ncbi:MAG: T9SS type A sorting domain-containing protein [Bacteroidia bacterium]
MRKIMLFCILALVAANSYGQVVLLDDAHTIVTNSIIDVDIVSGTNSTEEILVKNNGSVTDTLKVLRTILSVDANDQTQFCFGGLCYAFGTNLSSQSLIVNVGDTLGFADDGFHAIFNAGVACVTRMVHYRFYNVNNIADSAFVTFRYSCITGVDDNIDVKTFVSNPTPNPAYGSVSFNYAFNSSSQKAKIVIHDMLGKTVKTIDLIEKEGTVKINTSDLTSGVYFYSYSVDNHAVVARKVLLLN